MLNERLQNDLEDPVTTEAMLREATQMAGKFRDARIAPGAAVVVDSVQGALAAIGLPLSSDDGRETRWAGLLAEATAPRCPTRLR